MDPAYLNYFIHAANVLYLISYLVRDILWLRILSISAMCVSLPFYYLKHPPLWVPMAWISLSLVINIGQLLLLFNERRPIMLSEQEQRLYQMVFRALTPREFKKLLQIADWKTAEPGQMICDQGKKLDELMILFEGDVEVLVDGKPVTTLRSGRFVGEMSYMTGEPTSACVQALHAIRYVSWSRASLEAFLRNHSDLKAALQLVIGSDLVAKLRVRSS
jgi:hypothetical protein